MTARDQFQAAYDAFIADTGTLPTRCRIALELAQRANAEGIGGAGFRQWNISVRFIVDPHAEAGTLVLLGD
jgi:hypothetical protein